MSEITVDASLPSDAVKREAAVWIARIHAPDRTATVDAGLRRWLKERPEHQRAFELANELWDTAGRIPDGALPRMMRWKRAATRSPLPRFAIGFAVLAAVAVGVGLYFVREPVVTTDVGEQRTVTMEDGTRVSLNTATKIVVDYDSATRRIVLKSGEALFEVAKRSQWPFVVIAGDREITALGTSFVVRRDEETTAVTLVEGKVAINAPAQDTTTLNPGERMTFTHSAEPVLDRPEVTKVTSWQRGLVALDYTRLADAVTEMNRYSAVKLTIENAAAADARISGVFRAGDSLFFAQAIARTYGLEVIERRGRIELAGIPRAHIQ